MTQSLNAHLLNLMQKLILASQSPYRKAQLDAMGLKFSTASSNFDEDSLKKSLKNPVKLAQELAYQKALQVQKSEPDAIIIGCDQLVALGSEILGKAGSVDKAKAQLKKMSGKTHKLISAICVLNGKKRYEDVIIAKIKMRKLSINEISLYVDRDKPMDCAGSYRFESGAYGLIEKMDVSDPSSLIGTPLISLGKLLRKACRSESLIEYYS